MAINKEKILSVHHWNDKTFSLTTTRDAGFRFRTGEFAMIGLEVDGKPLLRAYSIASPNHQDTLEFLSIKVPDGPLTSRLQHVQPGDELLVNSKCTGTLVLDFLKPGRTLYLLATGTGLAPFMSVVRDPETYENYENIVLCHTVRTHAELAYKDFLDNIADDEIYGEIVGNKLKYIPTVTREEATADVTSGRCTDLFAEGALSIMADVPPADPMHDRVMACGSMDMNKQVIDVCEFHGYDVGTNSTPGTYVYEKAFVD